MPRFYDWDATLSRQTGTNGEICLVLGAKDIGKTFGLRLKCVNRFIKYNELFAEICRSKDEKKHVAKGYFDKLQQAGFFKDYLFKTDSDCGYIADLPKGDAKPQWRLCCYFVALTMFQTEKKRTFVQPKRFIFDEAIIDTKDRYHRYLKDEFFILANLLDSISRQQPNSDYQYYVYMLGNSVDITCPYLRYNGINKIPNFGYSWFKDKTVLLHYVEPWNSEERQVSTLVGRMLKGSTESEVIFDNKFEDTTGKEIMKKTSNAKYRFALIWEKATFAIWIDQKRGLWFVTSKLPKDAQNIYTLTKKDSSINYQMIQKASPLTKLLVEIYYIGGLRYESAHIRESFFSVLAFLGIK